jgi:hypothetical protein
MKPITTIASLTTLTLLLATSALAKPNLPPPVEDVVKMEKMAGPAGAFTTKENFPKDYFLIPKNLPYLVGMTLYDPSSSNLDLSKEQIDAILKIKKELMASAIEKALKVKKLELEVVEKIGLKHKGTKAADLYPTIDEIARLKAELTKNHLDCIEKIKAILTPKQFEEMIDYGIVNMF